MYEWIDQVRFCIGLDGLKVFNVACYFIGYFLHMIMISTNLLNSSKLFLRLNLKRHLMAFQKEEYPEE